MDKVYCNLNAEKAKKVIMNELAFHPYYSTVLYEILEEAVEHSIADLDLTQHDREFTIEEVHKYIIENYI